MHQPTDDQETLTLGCTFSDRIEALLDGRIGIDGFALKIDIVEPQKLFRSVLATASYDVAELSLSSFIAKIGAGDRTYVGLPIFLSRSFRHSNIYVRTDRNIHDPSDLAGKRVGLIEFQQTAAMWLRGMLCDQFGVERRQIEWIQGGLHAPVLTDRATMSLPPELKVSRSSETLDALLRRGEIDAIISPTAPSSFSDVAVPVDRLWPHFVEQETSYWERHRIFPIMHLLVVRRSLAERFGSLCDNLFVAFEAARGLAAADLLARDFPKLTLPWLGQHARSSFAALGSDPWTYGLNENIHELEMALKYAQEDGSAPAGFKVSDVFW